MNNFELTILRINLTSCGEAVITGIQFNSIQFKLLDKIRNLKIISYQIPKVYILTKLSVIQTGISVAPQKRTYVLKYFLTSDESVGFAGKLVIETKIRLYIHYIYLHTTNLNEN